MTGFENPIVVVTRPKASAGRFVQDLQRIAGRFEALVVPAFEIEAIPVEVPAFDVAIFTSKAGVDHAPKGAGRAAWCVGQSTASAAERAGYAAVSADGSARELIELILEKRPEGNLLHLRGEVSKENVMQNLRTAGLDCDEVVTYRKQKQSPSEALRRALGDGRKVLLPLFSAETVSIVLEWRCDYSGAVVVAISEDVAEAARSLGVERIVISERPDREAMTQATASLIA